MHAGHSVWRSSTQCQLGGLQGRLTDHTSKELLSARWLTLAEWLDGPKTSRERPARCHGNRLRWSTNADVIGHRSRTQFLNHDRYTWTKLDGPRYSAYLHHVAAYATVLCRVFLTYLLHCGVGVALPQSALHHIAINGFPNSTFRFSHQPTTGLTITPSPQP